MSVDPPCIDAVIASMCQAHGKETCGIEAEAFIKTLAECGYVIVPKEATPAAIKAGRWVYARDGADCYRKMVRAAAAIDY